MARDFRGLIAWQHADALVIEVYKITAAHFPYEEKFGLTSQLRQAAVSVAANIAEGSGRESGLDFRRFLTLAQGSLFEVEYYLHLARRLGILNSETYHAVDSGRAQVGSTLQGLIRSAGRQSHVRPSGKAPGP